MSEYGRDVAGWNADSGDLPPAASGVAAWNDFNPVAQAAREALQDAARIEIPTREFVLWVVAGYLLVLVPLNWLVFRGLGRVEWAWAAAPVVAIVSTVVVIRLAQLDIGFARSQSEIAVVELQGDYGQAHVTRYNALYTSLATSYDMYLDDPGAAVLPFPTVSRPEQFRLSLGQSLRRLTYRRGEQVSLSGFPVGSNSTGLIHSEEMLDLGGGIVLIEDADGPPRLTNQTGLNLYGAGLMRKTASGELQTAWLGTLPPGTGGNGKRVQEASTPIEWQAFDATESKAVKKGTGSDPAGEDAAENGGRETPVPLSHTLWADEREQSPITAAKPPPGALNLRRLIELGQDPADLAPGEVRLIAWSDNELPGLTIDPAAPQSRRAAMVVAHLAYGLGDAPKADVNAKSKPADRSGEAVMTNDENPNAKPQANDGATGNKDRRINERRFSERTPHAPREVAVRRTTGVPRKKGGRHRGDDVSPNAASVCATEPVPLLPLT